VKGLDLAGRGDSAVGQQHNHQFETGEVRGVAAADEAAIRRNSGPPRRLQRTWAAQAVLPLWRLQTMQVSGKLCYDEASGHFTVSSAPSPHTGIMVSFKSKAKFV
jgi:hypothetical protein